jgi:hypothetical protein
MVFCLRSCLGVVLTVLLATPTRSSRHGFRAQRPPTSLSLLPHSPNSSSPVLVALLIELVDVPLVVPLCIVHFSSLAYCCAFDEAQHCLDTGILEQDPQVLPIHSYRDLNFLGLQRAQHRLTFSSPYATLEHEVPHALWSAATPPAPGVLYFLHPEQVHARYCVS